MNIPHNDKLNDFEFIRQLNKSEFGISQYDYYISDFEKEWTLTQKMHQLEDKYFHNIWKNMIDIEYDITDES